MPQSSPDSTRDRVIQTMIGLTHPYTLQRIIISGNDSMNIDLSLRRRGFFRVSTTARCAPRGLHTVGLVVGHHSLQALQTLLYQISHYLSATASIAVVIDSHERGLGLKIRSKLEQFGFCIEGGTRCHEQFVLSAKRRDFSHMAKAA